MARLTVCLLGPFQATLDGQPIASFESDKVRALLAYLAVEAGRAHPREKLAGLLWPERPEPAARSNLAHALAVLRQAIGDRDATPPALHVERERIQFDRQSDAWVDVHAFNHLLVEGQIQSQALLRLEEAAALVRGPFLDGLSLGDAPAYEEWILLQREYLASLHLAALRRLVAAYQAQGAHETALRYAWKQVEVEPFEESARQQLMTLLALTGQRSAALAQYEALRTMLRDEMGVDPSEETTVLYARYKSAGSPRRNNLPVQMIPLVGREAELAEVMRLMLGGTRLVTLFGPGGIGKTRLALEAAAGAAADQTGAFPDGVYLVQLAGLGSEEGLAPAIAQAIGLSFSGGRGPRQQLVEYLRRKAMLLVLDNCEQVLEDVGVVADILSAAPGVAALATSRARLGLQGEHLFPVLGLRVPEEREVSIPEVVSCEAVKLFGEAARRVWPRFELESQAGAVARVCRLVEGIPLAILQAAAWVGTISPAAIAGEIGHSLDLLEAEWADQPARQRSMRAVFDSSWRLLGERDREVFAALSTFRGGFTREAARSVAGASLAELRRLVDRSFVQGHVSGRYEVHELLRQYGVEKLAEDPVAWEAANDRHCAYTCARLGQWEVDLHGPRHVSAVVEMDAETDNALAAWQWAGTHGQVERMNQAQLTLCEYLRWRGRWREGEEACTLAVQATRGIPSNRPDLLRLSARALIWSGVFGSERWGDAYEQRLVRESLSLLDQIEQAGEEVWRERVFALLRLGGTVWDYDWNEAKELFEKALGIARKAGGQREIGQALGYLGRLAMYRGDCEQAQCLQEEALSIARLTGDQVHIADALLELGDIANAKWRRQEGERLLQECIAVDEQIGAGVHLSGAVAGLTVSLRLQGRFEDSLLLEEKWAPRLEGLRSPLQEGFAMFNRAHAHLHLGRYEFARTEAEQLLAISREAQSLQGTGRVSLLLGAVAVASGTYTEAGQWLQDSETTFRASPWREHLEQALALLVYADRGLGDLPAATEHLCEALSIASDLEYRLPHLFALPAAALLYLDDGQVERAVELYALACCEPFVANSRWFEDVAGRQIAAAAARLPPPVVAAAQARGRARDIRATVADLLVELSRQDTVQPRCGGFADFP